MKKGTYVLIIVLFFLLLAAAGIVAYFAMEIGRPTVDVPSRSYLEVNLAGTVEEISPPDWFSALLRGTRPLSIYDVWMNFRKARTDERIQAMLLRVGYLQCDWAKATEIRDAILEFRRSGKKVYAYIEEAPDFDMEYYIATACDRIILHPLGWLGVNGIGGYVPFFKGTCENGGFLFMIEEVE